MLKYVPGLVGAIAAYFALIFIDWIKTGWLHALIFFGVYLFVHLALDKAMTGYGGKTPD